MNEKIDRYQSNTEEDERIRRRKIRIQQMKREKEKQLRLQRMIKRAVPLGVIALCVLAIATAGIVHAHTVAETLEVEKQDHLTEMHETIENNRSEVGTESTDVLEEWQSDQPAEVAEENSQPVVSLKQYSAHETSRTAAPPSEVDSSNVIFLERESNDILAARDCHTVINPASMTKVLTILVAAEHITNLDDTFTITAEFTDYSYVHDCSNAGFEKDEQVTVRDLFYGTILPSGGEAAVGLATYVAGSHEAFVELMNRKLEILGLSDTAHFTNCVGIYDKDHHCTVYDMAMIMEAALDNELCREVLSAHTYTTSATAEHPEGLLLSNWFLRRIEDQDTGGEVVCGKTGFVDQSGNCSVSFGVDQSGKEYICVTTGAHGSWRCIYDHTALYKKYAQEPG